jgi:peptidoglycan/xylan/chitin deacetylase (PgdA/CDA1 family)
MTPRDPAAPALGRRSFLAGAVLAVGGLAAACSDGGGASGSAATTGPTAPTAPTAPTNPPTTTAPAPSPTAPVPAVPQAARFVVSGPTTRNRVALTFHTNGDLDLASQLLAVLAARRVHVTAFVVGNWLDTNPDWAKRLVDDGHELANHTYTHPTFGTLSPDAMTDEIVRCRDLLARVSGSGGKYFRPSGTDDGTTSPGPTVLDVAGRAGYPVVLGFDVDPLDYDDPGADAVAQRTLATVRAGSIVSLHFGHPGTIAALPAILDGLDQKGLQPGTVSALLD